MARHRPAGVLHPLLISLCCLLLVRVEGNTLDCTTRARSLLAAVQWLPLQASARGLTTHAGSGFGAGFWHRECEREWHSLLVASVSSNQPLFCLWGRL